LGQCAVDKKSNEISAIPILLEQLDLAGTIITIDAMGTQKAIAQQITDAGADYILTLKANHPQLAKQAQQWFKQHLQSPHDNEVVISSAVLTEGGHHRLEQRQFWQVPVTEVFADALLQPWAGLQTLVIERSRRCLWNEETHATRFFISSLPPTFSEFPDCIRSHWAIENSLHWCLDVVFAEDASRVRKDHSPHNLSILHRLALNLLRQDPSKGSLKMKRYRAALDNRFLLSILQHSHLF
jgi:predicted transposase YbfD/YdcC